jgi:DNA-binding response OmpR family regulator
VWGEEFAGAVQVLYVHIGWLRERIEEDPRRPRYIQNLRGVGYKFAIEESQA